MPQHMRVRFELKAGSDRGALDHPGEAGRGERGTAPADETKGDDVLSRWSRRSARSSSPLR
jgi:hypothetical protein